MLLLRVTGALDVARVPYAIVGSSAAMLHGVVREPSDLGVVVRYSESHYQQAEKAMRSISLEPRLSAADVYRHRDDLIRNRGLTVWGFINHAVPTETAEIDLTVDLAEVSIVRLRLGDQYVKVASMADLMRMGQTIRPAARSSEAPPAEARPAEARVPDLTRANAGPSEERELVLSSTLPRGTRSFPELSRTMEMVQRTKTTGSDR